MHESEKAFMGHLRLYIQNVGSQKSAAKELGISPQYLCDVLAGRRSPSDRLAKAFGFEREVHYVEK